MYCLQNFIGLCLYFDLCLFVLFEGLYFVVQLGIFDFGVKFVIFFDVVNECLGYLIWDYLEDEVWEYQVGGVLVYWKIWKSYYYNQEDEVYVLYLNFEVDFEYFFVFFVNYCIFDYIQSLFVYYYLLFVYFGVVQFVLYFVVYCFDLYYYIFAVLCCYIVVCRLRCCILFFDDRGGCYSNYY